MPKTSKSSKKKRTKSKAKTTHKKKIKTKKTSSSPTKRYEAKIDKALIDNFVTLQKIMVNFSTRFDALTNQISKLLELFEISAKALARKDLETGGKDRDTKKIMEKLENLSEQAGLIGKGLALIHETSSGKTSPKAPPMQPQSRPGIPPRRPAPFLKRPSAEMQGYQRSIASRDFESRPSKSMTKEIPR